MGRAQRLAKAAVAMLATTFGIALEWQIKTGPFPGLSTEDTRGLWNSSVKQNEEERDTWEQLCWFIKNMSITERLNKLEKKVVKATQDQKRVLQRAEKNRMLNDEPRSLATSIPRRKRNGFDDNIFKKKCKLDTVDATIDIMKSSNENNLTQSKHHGRCGGSLCPFLQALYTKDEFVTLANYKQPQDPVLGGSLQL